MATLYEFTVLGQHLPNCISAEQDTELENALVIDEEYGDDSDEIDSQYLTFHVSRDDIIKSFRNQMKEIDFPHLVIDKIVFENEDGEDGGGLFNEFHVLFVQEAIKSLFILDHADQIYVPNDKCDAKYDYINFGIVLGSAVHHRISLKISFSPLVLDALSSYSEKIEIDETLTKYLENIKKMNRTELEDANLFFEDFNGKPLEENSKKSKKVKFGNKNRYIELLTKRYSYRFAKQLRWLIIGFTKSTYKIYSSMDIQEIICGTTFIDVTEWKTFTQSSVSPNLWSWFWEYVSNSSDEKRIEIFRWISGRDSVPCNGLSTISELPFSLVMDSMGCFNCLPRVSTCALTVYFPSDICSKEELEKRFDRAIVEMSFYAR